MCGAPRYGGWKEGMVAQRNGGRERLLMYRRNQHTDLQTNYDSRRRMRPQLINFRRATRFSLKM